MSIFTKAKCPRASPTRVIFPSGLRILPRLASSVEQTLDVPAQTEEQPTELQKSPLDVDAELRAVMRKDGFLVSTETLLQALVHPWISQSSRPSNERLARLGFAAIKFFSAEILFTKYPHADRAQLRKLEARYTSMAALDRQVKKLAIRDYVQQKTADPEGHNGKPLPVETANSMAFGAIIGAIYHEKGAAAAKGFLEKSLFKANSARPMKQRPDLSAVDASAP